MEAKPRAFPPAVRPVAQQAVPAANNHSNRRVQARFHPVLRAGFFLLPLFFLVCLPTASRPETLSEGLKQRLHSFYSSLRNKDIRSYSLRQEIIPFFFEIHDLDQFIVTTLVRMEKSGIKDTRIRKYKIMNIELAKGEARVTVKISGYYLLFLKTSFLQVDRWEYRKTESGKEDWFLVPLSLEEGSG